MDKFTHRFKFELGIEVKSDITGFHGVITDRACNLNGCDRYWIAPSVDKDGKYREGRWFDEYEIIIVNSTAINREAKKEVPPGGPSSSIK